MPSVVPAELALLLCTLLTRIHIFLIVHFWSSSSTTSIAKSMPNTSQLYSRINLVRAELRVSGHAITGTLSSSLAVAMRFGSRPVDFSMHRTFFPSLLLSPEVRERKLAKFDAN